jgi:FkbM family methyltransferase
MSSQFEEDQIIAELLPQDKGFYVDVGAFHPIKYSNTYALYQKGWAGVAIDPMDWSGAWRRDRPRDVFVCQAVGDKAETKTIHFCEELTSFDARWFRGVNTEKVHPLLKGPRRVKVDTLMTILEPYPQILKECLLCSIDVEGYEQHVLQGIDFSVFCPKLIVIEALGFLVHKPLYLNWEPLLVKSGYSYLKSTENGMNRFYWRRTTKRRVFFNRRKNHGGRGSLQG